MPKPANKKIIVVDIDDVLSAHADAFIRYTNDRWGTNLTLDDYDEHWAKVWKVDREEEEKRALEYHQSGAIGKYQIQLGAKEALLRLKSNFKLFVLTSRRQSIRKETLQWVDEYYKGIFQGIFFSGIWDKTTLGREHHTKADIIKELGAEYFIDDQLKHCIPAAELGIKVLLFGDYPWNQAGKLPKGIT